MLCRVFRHGGRASMDEKKGPRHLLDLFPFRCILRSLRGTDGNGKRVSRVQIGHSGISSCNTRPRWAAGVYFGERHPTHWKQLCGWITGIPVCRWLHLNREATWWLSMVWEGVGTIMDSASAGSRVSRQPWGPVRGRTVGA